MRPFHTILVLLMLWLGTTQGVVTAQKSLPMERLIRHQDQDNNGDLVIYQDPVYAYSIVVPSNWIIEPTPYIGWGGVAQFTILPPKNKLLIPQDTEVDWSKTGGLRAAIGVVVKPRRPDQSLSDFIETYEQVQVADRSSEWLTTSTEIVTLPGIGIAVKRSREIMGMTSATYYLPIGRWVMSILRMPSESPWDADFARMLGSLRISAETEESIENQFGSVWEQQPQPLEGGSETLGQAKPDIAWDEDPPGWELPFLGLRTITQGPGCWTTHQGAWFEAIDYSMPVGTAIQATDGGYVLDIVTNDPTWGNLVKLRHGSDGFDSWYAHLNSFRVRLGQSVWQYQVIGYSGNTGNSTGPHLHFHAKVIAQQATHWIRTLPVTTWYSGDPYSPCADGNDGEANGG
jgi:murein DD-endopeptidase MepM/ murein hydrolase activator NlpD